MEQIPDWLRSVVVSYALVAGTGVLLVSWILEKYQAAHWEQQAADLDDLNSRATQDLILAQSNAMFLTRGADAARVPPGFETNQDVQRWFAAAGEILSTFHERLPATYREGLPEVQSLVTETVKLYSIDVEREGRRALSGEESQTVSALAAQIQSLVAVGEGALANNAFSDAGLERLRVLASLTEVVEQRPTLEPEIRALEEELKQYSSAVAEGRLLRSNTTTLARRLNDVTAEVTRAFHLHSAEVVRKKYRYASVYRAFYVIGSVLVLLSMIVKAPA